MHSSFQSSHGCVAMSAFFSWVLGLRHFAMLQSPSMSIFMLTLEERMHPGPVAASETDRLQTRRTSVWCQSSILFLGTQVLCHALTKTNFLRLRESFQINIFLHQRHTRFPGHDQERREHRAFCLLYVLKHTNANPSQLCLVALV